jgi:proteasome lid subunit RPN8/RPN11
MSGLRISRALYDEMVAHALAEAPNECCGIIAAVDSEAVRLYRATNAHESPRYAYNVGGDDLQRILREIDDQKWDYGAIYHSHPRSEPIPSQTDINVASIPGTTDPWWPGTIYIIIGLKAAEPEVKAWHIRPHGYDEVALSVE